jgi:hypothetical protein
MDFRSWNRFVLNGWIFGAALAVGACGSTSTESVTGPSAPKCSVSLSGPAESIGADGGAGSVVVTTQPECAWTATAEASWITALTPAQGQGDGQVQFQAGPNPNAAARSGAININGQRAVVQQGGSACDVDLRISVSQFAASGGAGVVNVVGPGGCPWTASANVGWLGVSPAAGAGSGDVSFTVAANAGAARTGVITIGGHPVTIQQAAANAPTCTVTINPTSQSVPASGATGLAITVTATSGCARPATSNAAWITVASGATGSGNGTVTLNVAANTGAFRSGTVTIGGQTFTVNQAEAQTCTVAINPTSQSVPAAGVTGITVTVTAPSGCPRPATSNAAWITVTSGATGSGSGAVTLNVAANTGAARNGTVTIGTQTFTVNQAAAGPQCSYAINPTAQTVGSDSGTGLPVAVTAGAGCPWTAAVNPNFGWLQITSGSSGSGNGTVNFTFSNFSGTNRTGTMTIAGQTFTVTQVRCTFTVAPTTQSVAALGGSFTASVTTQTGCRWTADSNASWLNPTNGTNRVGSGTLSYSVGVNLGGARSGRIDIEEARLDVNQAAVLK